MAQQLKKEGAQVSFIFMLDPPRVKREFAEPASVMDRLKLHSRELTKCAFREKLTYVLSRFASRIATPAIRLKDPFMKLCWTTCLRLGCRLPSSLRTPYLVHIYRRALESYAPQPYSGSVTIFKAQSARYVDEWDWKRLITGELEIYEHSAQHMDLTTEPQLRYWAVQLKKSIDRVEEERQTNDCQLVRR
jgi:thioesterase domain-containing protein